MPSEFLNNYGEFLILFVTLIILIWQIRVAVKQNNLGAIFEIFKELSSEESRQLRSFIYNNRGLYKALNDGGDWSKLPDETRKNAYEVSAQFNRIGYLIYKKLIPANLILDNFYYLIARSWVALEPFIMSTRKARSQENYLEYFEFLANKVFEKPNKYIAREKVTFTGESYTESSQTQDTSEDKI